ncbi:MAG: UDP-N-acetylmuramoyl-L-alanyl-D-glutamate--2,6-diaminopimelate ligase [Gaiellales bacterium]|nr:MAG: UDP-N-acetylmuramoyl-L-alanyl-D-glutamate--2,6-diaminopimelate ligase [Gaiellales bacterium]
MRLGEITRDIGAVRSDADPALEVTGLAYDSRRVRPGQLFAAIPGFKADGHDFITAAAEAGASVALTERWVEGAVIPQVQVPDVRLALALASAEFYGRPSERLKLIGVTGTNGKTTTTHMIQSILEAAGRRSALLGGVEYRIAGKAQPAERTTPESVDLQQMLSRAVEGGDRFAVLEVSSHGIELFRAAALDFDVAVFTNLTRDHLDLHSDMESYYATKRRLFYNSIAGEQPESRMPVGVINIDDAYGARLAGELAAAGGEVVSFGASSGALVSAANIVYSGWTTSFDLVTPAGVTAVEIAIPGSFSLANALAAAAAAHALGLAAGEIAAGLKGHRGAPGRFEPVETDAPFHIVIDYAHNEDGLQRAIDAARHITPGRLIVVFGCPGERDRDKRPKMGLVAGKGSDLAILTTDDCYGEPPGQILDAAESGLTSSGSRYLRIADRREAIRAAIEAAGPGDTILIAGKGHETRQIMSSGPVPFSDRQTVLELLAP